MKEEKNSVRKWIYWFSLAVAIILMYYVLGNLSGIVGWIKSLLGALTPFCVGLLIAYILYMPCKSIEETLKKTKAKSFVHKHARGLSILLTYIIALIIIVILFNVIVPIVIQSLVDLFANLPDYYNTIIEKIQNLPEDNILRSEKAMEMINSVRNINFSSLLNVEKIQQYIRGVISAVGTIINSFIAIIVSVYILAQRKSIIRFLARLTGAITTPKTYQKIRKYFTKGNNIFFRFLASQVLDAILVGVLVSIVLSILKVKYSILLGFMIGLFNLIPYFGAIVAVIIAILITILTGGVGKALLMTIFVVILQQIDANIINPKIVGDSLEISQLLVIFAVTLGGAYFGVIGMFLSVPVATVIKIIIDDFIEEKENRKNKEDINQI